MFSNINTINKFLQKIINHLPLLRFEIMISRYESPPTTSRTFLLKACLTWDQRNTKRWDSLSKFDSFLNSVTRIFYFLPGHEKNEKIFKTFFENHILGIFYNFKNINRLMLRSIFFIDDLYDCN